MQQCVNWASAANWIEELRKEKFFNKKWTRDFILFHMALSDKEVLNVVAKKKKKKHTSYSSLQPWMEPVLLLNSCLSPIMTANTGTFKNVEEKSGCTCGRNAYSIFVHNSSRGRLPQRQTHSLRPNAAKCTYLKVACNCWRPRRCCLVSMT